jgi:hypothetical protein
MMDASSSCERESSFTIPPAPHDSWVIRDQPYVSLHFLGADHYTKR